MVPGQPGASAGSASPLCWVPHSGAWLKWRAGSAGLLVDHNSPRGSAGFGCLLQVAWQGDKRINELKRAKSYICIRKNFKKPKPSLKKIVQEKNGWHFVCFFFPKPQNFCFLPPVTHLSKYRFRWWQIMDHPCWAPFTLKDACRPYAGAEFPSLHLAAV